MGVPSAYSKLPCTDCVTLPCTPFSDSASTLSDDQGLLSLFASSLRMRGATLLGLTEREKEAVLDWMDPGRDLGSEVVLGGSTRSGFGSLTCGRVDI